MSRPLLRLCLLIVVAAIVPACGGGGNGVGTAAPVIFNKARGFDSTVQSIALATDGSGDVYVGGAFNFYSTSPSNGIVRLNSDGSVDGTFVIGTGFSGIVYSIATATDGSGDVYVGGGFTSYNGTGCSRIVRLNSNGSIDGAFVVGTGFDNQVYSIVPAADGSGDVYVGGDFTSYNGTGCSRIVRLNSDGSIDGAFAVGSGFDNHVYSIAPAADGSGDVYVGGTFTSYNGTGCNGIVRLNSDGSIDGTFVIGSGFAGNVFSLAPATDGSGDVYVGGEFPTYSGTGCSCIVRLNSNGSIDGAFVVGSGFAGGIYSIAPAADGSGDIYVGGGFTLYNGTVQNRIVGLHSNGSINGAFVIGTGLDSPAYSNIAPATDGSGNIYIGGGFTSYNGTGCSRIARLSSNGNIDAAFVVGSAFDYIVQKIAPATDGSGDVYVGGSFSFYNGSGSKRLIRLHSDGTVNGAFVVGTGFDNYVYSIVPAADGSGDVYVGGTFTSYNGTGHSSIVRLNSDGSVDGAFVTGIGFNTGVYSIAPATDGSGDVYVGGDFISYNGTGCNCIVRLNSNGSIDGAFVVGSGFNGTIYSIAPATDGSGDVYVGGSFNSYNGTGCNRIVRLNSNGSIDGTFVVGSGFDNSVQSIAPATDGTGDVYVGGSFSSYNGTGSSGIVRLNSNGSIDGAFVVGSGFDYVVRSIAPVGDGSGDVYVGGNFTLYNGAGRNRVVRLHSDGSVDGTFVVGTGFNNPVQSIAPAVDGSGNVYVGGSFGVYNSGLVDHIVRLSRNGMAD